MHYVSSRPVVWMLLLALSIPFSGCDSDAPREPEAPEPTPSELTALAVSWREVIQDRRGTVWMQQTPVIDALQRLDSSLAQSLETLNLAASHPEGDPRCAQLMETVSEELKSLNERLVEFESRLRDSNDIADAFRVVRAAVSQTTFLESAGVDVRSIQATVREAANLHREGRKLWGDQMRLILEGQPTDPVLLEAGLATVRKAADSARPVQKRVGRAQTTVVQRQNLKRRTLQRLLWAEGFLKSLKETDPFRANGFEQLKGFQARDAVYRTEADTLDKTALNPSRKREEAVRDHREGYAALLHQLTAAYLTRAKELSWPLPR